MIRVGIAGAGGRMGRALMRAVAAHPGLQPSTAWERPGHAALGQDAGELAGLGRIGVSVGDDPATGLEACEVALDFTAPAATAALAPLAAKRGCALVAGTTGLSADQLADLEQAARKIAVVYATNFTTGVNLLWALARRAAAVLGPDYDAEIIEAHHNQKQDAPSGTALTLFREVCRGRGLDPEKAARHGRQGLMGARGRDEVGLHAVRGGDIAGDHTVLFAGAGERLELKHQAHTRETFAQGATRAAAWAAGRAPGWYGMADVLGLQI